MLSNRILFQNFQPQGGPLWNRSSLNKFEIIQIRFDRLGPTCHTLLSPFLSLISGAYTRDGPTCRPPCSHFSLPRTEPLSPLRSPARDMCAARPTPPLSGCPTTPSLAQPHPALKPPPPPSAILPHPSPSRHSSAHPASAATPSPCPTADKGPQRLIVAVSSHPLGGTRLESRSLHASFTRKA
jgi:hypothetical protein